MPQLVEISGVGTVEFPDEMSRADISDRIKNQIIPKYRRGRPADSIPVVAPTEDPTRDGKTAAEWKQFQLDNEATSRRWTAVADVLGPNTQQAVQNLNPAIGIPNAITAGLRALGVPETEAPNITPEIVESTPLLELPNFTKKNWIRPFTTQRGINERIGGGRGTIPESDPVLGAGLGVYDAAQEFIEGLSTGNMVSAMFVGGAPAIGAKIMEAGIAGSSILGLPDAFYDVGKDMVEAEEAILKGEPINTRNLFKSASRAALATAFGIGPSGRAFWADRAQRKWEETKRKSPTTKGTDTRVKDAIAKVKSEGPTPEFRSLFGGIDPAIVGTTHAKVKALADSLGLPYDIPAAPVGPKGAKAPKTKKPAVTPVPSAPATTEAIKTTVEGLSVPEGAEPPGVPKVDFPIPEISPVSAAETAADVPTPAPESPLVEDVVSDPVEPPKTPDVESGYIAPTVPQEMPPSASPVRDLILSDKTTMEKSLIIRRMAKDQGVSVKEVQEAVEAEIVVMSHEIASDMGLPRDDAFKELVAIYDKQPLLSSRTSTSIENQAYSTPAPLAYALRNASLTGIKTSVYDATGGTGMLFIGSDLSKSVANELQPGRAEALRKLGVSEVTENDATEFIPATQVGSVHVNPPFGSIPNVNFDGFGIRKLEHLITLKALKSMKDNGTAAIVLGANMNVADTAKGAQWVFENYLYSRYHVADNFEVDGDLYGKQGAKWPVRILIVAGRRAEPLTGELAPKRVDRLSTWDEVWARSESARNEVKRIREGLEVRGPGTVPGAPGKPTTAEEPGIPVEGAIEPARPPGGGGKRGGGRGSQPPAKGEPGGRSTPVAPIGDVEGKRRPAKPSEEPASAGEPTGGMEGRPGKSEVQAPAAEPGKGGDAGSKPRSVSQPANLDQKQIEYIPTAEGNPFGTLTPGNIGGGTHKYLAELEKQVGPLTEFASKKTGIPVEKLKSSMSSDQIDGVALAIYQIEKGTALIVGHETGIGKGRIAAATLEYAKANGKIPIFVTKDPKLFSDMFGDISDVGGTIKKPLIFGDPSKSSIVDSENNTLVKSPSAEKQKAAIQRITDEGFDGSGYDSIFLTYSQVNQDNIRQKFLEELASKEDVVVVMDEAHESAGDGNTSMQAAFFQGGVVERGSGADKTQVVKEGLLNESGTKVGRGGVMYLSATWAKRPDNVPLYFRTDLSKASQSFPQIVGAMKSGGVALQQAISEALAKSGQYTRLERDFSGVKYSMSKVEGPETESVVKSVDDVTDVLRDIVGFSKVLTRRVKGANKKSTAMSESSMAMTEFASKVHNTIGQLLLAAKADAVIGESEKSFKNGGKPVIALMNTMESFLNDYVADHGINNGDPIKITWADLVKHALSRTLRVTEKLPNGDSRILTISPESFGLKDTFDRITAAAEKLDIPFPVSPIDYILQGLSERGIKMAELTGRKSGIEYTNAKKGEGTYKTFKKANKNTVVNGFNSGVYDGMLLNASGSTGLSAHASTRFKDRRKRDMIIAQPSNDINVFIQTLGRIRRTGMIPGSAEYIHLVLPLQAEIRPAAMTNQKMKSLNANTTAESGGALKMDVEDILNKYGDEVVAEYLDANQDMQIATGIDIRRNDDGSVVVPDDVARQFTGRMAVMRDADQKTAYDQILPAYREYIDHLKTTGEYDLDIIVHSDWDAVRQSDTKLSAGTDESSIFTSSTRAQEWEITDNRHVPTGEEMLAEFKKNTGGVRELEKTWEDFQNDVDGRISKGIERAENNVEKIRDLSEMDTFSSMRILRAEIELNDARRQRDRWNGTQLMVDRILRLAGEPITISTPQTAYAQDGMLVKVKFPDLKKGLWVTGGAFRFNYLVNAPGGKISVSGAQFSSGRSIQTESSKSIQDFTGVRKGERYNRWVVTGNPIAAYQNTGGSGQMVRFATRGGDVVTGLMMPNSWDLTKLVSDPRLELINGAAVANFFEKIPTYSTAPVELRDGSVWIERYRGKFSISVAKPKKIIHLDKQLRGITGDFTKTGSGMLVSVYDKETMARAVDRIMTITASKFSAPPNRTKGDQQPTIDLIAKVNEESQTKPPKWGRATGESGFVLDPMVIAKEIIENLKDVGGYLKRAAGDAINLAKEIQQEQFKIGKPSDYRKAKLKWVGRQQRGWQEAREAQRDIRGVLKDPVTDEAGYAWIEAAGDAATLRRWAAASKDPARKAAYLRALSLTPTELDMVQAVSDTFLELANEAQAEGMLNTFRDNYAPHLWDIGKKPSRSSGRKVRDRMTHSMARTFATSFDGEQLGFVPKTKRLSEVVPIYIVEMRRVIADRRFARDLRRGRSKGGDPLVQMQGIGIPVDGPQGQATLVMPDVPKNKSVRYSVMPNQPALHDWIWVQKDSSGNPIYLKADMALHPDIVTDMEAILGKSAIKAWYQGDKGGATVAPVKWALKKLDRGQAEFKKLMLGFFATFHQVQELTHGIGHRVTPLKRPKIDLVNNPVHQKYVNHGLMLYPDRVSQNDFMQGFGQSNLISNVPVLGKFADMYSDYLFHEFIPEMKLRTMDAAFKRNMKVFAKELASNETTESAVMILSAEQVNAAYGHLNYTDLGRSPTLQHILQLAFLAPDFLEARTRFWFQAAKGAAGAKVGREQAIALGFLAVSQAVLAWLAAKLIDGEWDPKHPFEVRKGNRVYTMRSVPEDFMALLDEPREFIFNRINPLVGKGAAMVATGKDWRGAKVDTIQIIQELAQGWIPLTVRPWVVESNTGLQAWEQWAGSLGFKISYYSATAEMFKAAREWKKKSGDSKLVAEAKRDESETHLPSDYTPMRRALENGDDKAAIAEYTKLLETKSRIQVWEAMAWNKPISGAKKTERDFVESLTEDQKAIYALSLQTRKLLYSRFLKMRSKMSKSSEK